MKNTCILLEILELKKITLPGNTDKMGIDFYDISKLSIDLGTNVCERDRLSRSF